MTKRMAFAAVICSLVCTFACGQDKPRVAFTRLEDAGPDYAVQGEYEGQIPGQGYVGLQVIAQGTGEFTAVRYAGGLPGAGWDRVSRRSYQGQLRGTTAVLTGESGIVEIADGIATLRASGGGVEGQLQRLRRISASLDAAPLANAAVLFDGYQVAGLKDAKVDDGLLDVGFTTEQEVQDFQLHVEFRTPFMPNSRGQARGNSGLYIQRRYEVQVLDSFGLEGVENECGGLYRQKRPDVNMCLPPLQWQTYDIAFRAARWNDGKKLESARITVLHNGVAIHNNYAFKNKTGAGRPEGPEPGPILFQNHRDPVRFRNLWIVQHNDSAPHLTVQAEQLVQPATTAIFPATSVLCPAPVLLPYPGIRTPVRYRRFCR